MLCGTLLSAPPFCPECLSPSLEQEAPLPCCQCQLSDKRGPCVQTWDRDQRRSPGCGGPSSDAPATAGHSLLFHTFNMFLPMGSIYAGGSAWPFKGQCIAFLPQKLPQTSSSADGSSLFPPSPPFPVHLLASYSTVGHCLVCVRHETGALGRSCCVQCPPVTLVLPRA